MATETCAHCGNAATVGSARVHVEWNPVNETWQCRDVVACAQRTAEATLAARLRRELGGAEGR